MVEEDVVTFSIEIPLLYGLQVKKKTLAFLKDKKVDWPSSASVDNQKEQKNTQEKIERFLFGQLVS